MNTKLMRTNVVIVFILVIEALVLSVMSILQVVLDDVFLNVVSFPFVQIGMVLRWLSLSGSIQNIISIIIYVLICASPILLLVTRKPMKNKKYFPEDALILLLCALMFYVIYHMINPSYINALVATDVWLSMTKAMMSTTIYSLLATYFVIRVIRKSDLIQEKKIYKVLSFLLNFVSIAFVAAVFGTLLRSVVTQISELMFLSELSSAGFTSNSSLTPDTSFVVINISFVVFDFLVKSVPYIAGILVVFVVTDLLFHFEADRYSENTINTAKKLSNLCKKSIVLIMCSDAFFNFAQLLFRMRLMNSDFNVTIPILSIISLFACVVLTNLIVEGKDLKDDNDGFI